MPKVTETKIGRVLLKEIEPGKWRVDYREALTKKRCRVVLPASNFKDAKKQADEINTQISAGKGFGGRLRGSVGHTVQDAVKEAIKHTDANERTRADYSSRYNAFSEYLTANAPGVQSWADVTEQVLANYIEHCRREGVSHDTLRMRLYVLRLTSAYMARTYPNSYRHVTDNLKLRRYDPSKAEIEADESILNRGQLIKLLGWLQTHDPMIHCWAIMQGLCGMRLLECAYLREQDINPVAGTISIAESSAHKPKNRHSYRTVPVPSVVMHALESWIADMKVRHEEGYLFFSHKKMNGRAKAKSCQARAGAYTVAVISRFWDEALAKACSDGIKVSKAFTARRLRSTYVTAMRGAGADFAVLQRYIGHAPSTILSAHYDKVDMARLKAIAKLGQDLYEGSGTFAEKKAEATKKSGVGQLMGIQQGACIESIAVS